MKIKVSDLRSMIAEAVAHPSEYTYVMDVTFGDDVERLKVPGVQFGTRRELQKSREERWKGLEEWKTNFFNRFGDLPLVKVDRAFPDKGTEEYEVIGIDKSPADVRGMVEKYHEDRAAQHKAIAKDEREWEEKRKQMRGGSHLAESKKKAH